MEQTSKVLNQQAFPESNTVGAVVVAGGSGSRASARGALPKQFVPLAGKPVLLWSVDALLRCNKIACVVVVGPSAELGRIRAMLAGRDGDRVVVTAGGEVRTDSVRAGLAALEGRGLSRVLIHDAARPGLTLDVIEELIAALASADAASPALSVADALKLEGPEGLKSVPREGLMRVQTPQAFRFDLIRDALADPTAAAVDDLALVEGRGARVALTPGRQALMKITHPEDFETVAKLIGSPASGPVMRIGQGFDVHGFEPGDHVTLCGVRIPHTMKLEGHSDADAGWHALTDAILGAAALGDIGDHFPPSDPQWRGADSRIFLVHAVKLAAQAGFSVVNADITLICEKPKISPHRDAMRAATAEALGVDISCVGVKATTTEKLGFLGRGEGIAAQAVVMLAGA